MVGSAVPRFSLPDDPTLAQIAAAYRNAGAWCYIVDDAWRFVYATDDAAELSGDGMRPGLFMFGSEAVRVAPNSGSDVRKAFAHVGGWVLVDFGADRDRLRHVVDAQLADLVDSLEPNHSEVMAYEETSDSFAGIVVSVLAQRIRDDSGHVVGTVTSCKPPVDMTTLFMLAGSGDVRHFGRMRQLATANRRPAAVLFADLEHSAQLARQMPTASYLTLVRRLIRAADRCVVDAGGLVGRHVGDGVTAFFDAESAGSESAAARACIGAARELQASMPAIAERHGLPTEEFVVRVGLHWGATLYIGSIITAGRTEVTALGDEVNEAARIEACATGGRCLASKALIERLDPEDATLLGIDPTRVAYSQLSDLASVTDKARRDAPAIPVCDVSIGSLLGEHQPLPRSGDAG